MSFLSRRRLAVCAAVFVAASIAAWQSAAAAEPVHAAAGVVKKVDAGAKTIAIETADGTEHVYKFTERTTVEAAKGAAEGVKKATLATYHGTLEGSQAVIRYTEKGGDKVAVGVKDLGKDSVKVAEGTVKGVDKGAHTLTVKTKDGAEETYDLSKDAAIDTSHGVVDASKWSYKAGDKVTVHYTEDAGKKVAHLVKHL